MNKIFEANMQKRILIFFLLCLTITISSPLYAQMKNITNKAEAEQLITAVGFMDYPPVGYIDKVKYKNADDVFVDKYRTVFEDIINEFSQATEKRVKYIFDRNKNYEELIRNVRGGEYDMVLGVYHETQLYEGLDVVFPSLLNNPISIIMLPKNTGKVKNLAQLKTLKGAISTKEYLSDYVTEQLKNYNLEYIDEPQKMFEKLYMGEIDYVFASYFFGIVETAKLGLRDKLTFSKQVIWNMPLFIGVSKTSSNRKYLVGKLTSYSERPDSKAKLENKLRQMIMDIELQYKGTIPPAYSQNSI